MSDKDREDPFWTAMVERIAIPLAGILAIVAITVVCRELFGGEVAGELFMALLAIGGLIYMTPLYEVVKDYVKYEIFKAEGDPLKKKPKE